MISGLMSSRVFTLGSVTAQRKNLLVEAHVRLLMYYTDLYPDAYALSPEHARAPCRSGASPSVLRTTCGAAVSRWAAGGGGNEQGLCETHSRKAGVRKSRPSRVRLLTGFRDLVRQGGGRGRTRGAAGVGGRETAPPAALRGERLRAVVERIGG